MQKENVKKYAILMAITGILLMMTGVGYALFTYFGLGSKYISITANGVTFSYLESKTGLSLTNATPIPDDVGKIDSNYFEFYIRANSNDSIEIPYFITTRKTNSSSDIDDAIKLYLTRVSENGSEEEVALVKFSDLKQYTNSGIDLSKYVEKLLYNTEVPIGKGRYRETYRLRMWIDLDTNFVESKYNNANFSLKVNVYALGDKSLASTSSIENVALQKMSSIRNHSNTDISDRNGPIYYVSNDGDDNNDGLSEATPIKTLDKLEQLSSSKQIIAGSTILFRDGDTFRGKIKVRADDIMLGSYGDISKGKPRIYRSTHDGAKEGSWVEVKPNIWKYTLNGSDTVFTNDVGTIWMFCNKGNNNCTKSMIGYDRTFEYAQKRLTKENYDETNIEENITDILKNDLEVYHAGHPSRDKARGQALYMYSTSNPAERFDEIEFSLSYNLIEAINYTDLKVDNLTIMFAGSHAIGTYSVANLTITNNEIGFIGGATQKYENSNGYRYGNAVQVWGGVQETNGIPVKDGFLIDNNITYQVYDTAYTWQYTLDKPRKIEKAVFSNNVLDNIGADIEYWFNSENHPEYSSESYVEDFQVKDNIFLRSGYGIAETRPNHEQFGFVTSRMKQLYVKGQILFENNVFWQGKVKFFVVHANQNNYPTIINNTFYTDVDMDFMQIPDDYQNIKYDINLLPLLYPNNTFLAKNYNEKPTNDDSGKVGNINWEYIASTNTLNITGSGDMEDYSLDNLAPWHKYKEFIYNINIGEDITKLGAYAFYDYTKLINLRIDSKTLKDLSRDDSWNGTNYTFYHAGSESNGVKVVFGPNVTNIPSHLFIPETVANNGINISKIKYEGNKIKSVGYHALTHIKQPILIVNDATTSTKNMAFAYNNANLIIIPNSLTDFGAYLFNSDTFLEKVVFGPSIPKLTQYTFRNCKSIKTIVMPHIDNSNVASDIFSTNNNDTITVYGDETTEEWANNYNQKETGKMLVYKPLSEYRIDITSNSNISGTVAYNNSFTFEANGNVKAYYRYKNSYDPSYRNYNREYLSDPLVVEKNGSTYTIKNIKSDIYIEVE